MIPGCRSARHRPHFHAHLVVQREAVDQVCASAVGTDHFDLLVDPAQPRHDAIERADRRDIPEMRGRNVDRDVGRTLFDASREKSKLNKVFGPNLDRELFASCDDFRGYGAKPLKRLANRLVTPTGLEIK